ncbi:MAG: class I SAM-dependent methyltransferase [Erysipelotrichaceae bacterium]|nr:class I SAM-dependent methyltransferase [Erysipelotrichaceae bacterium]
MYIARDFSDYLLLDCGDGEKLESWKGILLRRPDPLAIWPKQKPELWKQADAVYHRSSKGGGSWEYLRTLPKEWTLSYRALTFRVAPTDFKHTGLFPEQAANWSFLEETIRERKKKGGEAKILNLFAYTGAATMAAAAAGADEVVHVDAAKGMVNWAKENMHLSALDDCTIRFIVEDCQKFLKREIRRGHRYDGILMDPPSYGRGPNNELFRFEDQINELLELSFRLLSDDPLFLLVSSYTTGYSCTVMKNVMEVQRKNAGRKGRVESQELGIPVQNSELILPCGITTRYLPQ